MDERQQYLEAIENTCEGIGWRLICEDVQKQIDGARAAMEGVTDLRGLGLLQGRIGAFMEILTLGDHIKAQLSEPLEDADI